MATIVTHQPRPIPASRHQRSAAIAYPSSHIPNQSQSSLSSYPAIDLHHRSYRSNRPPQFPPSNHHHIPHSPPHPHHPFHPQLHRSIVTTATATFGRHTSPALSPSDPLIYTPSENFFDPGQLPWSESNSELKIESSPVSQPVFYADSGSHAFYNDPDGNPAVDTQLLTSQPQPHAQPQQISEMFSSALRQVVYLSPSAKNEKEMGGNLDLHYPTSSPSPHSLPPAAAAPTFVHPFEDMSPSAFSASIPFPHVPGSSSPPGLTCLTLESDEDPGSESGESEVTDPWDGADGNDDGDFIASRMTSLSLTQPRCTSSNDSGSVSAPRPCRLSAPVPVPNLTKKSRGRRVPTAPVFIVQGGAQKNMRMYRCAVEGCYKCFALGEHLKRHVRSIHTNEKRECFPPFFGLLVFLILIAVVAHKCPVEGCGKDFSLHDNLGQHMRVHKGKALIHLLGDA